MCINKLLSGRWILTVVCGGIFAYCSIVGKLTPEAIASILSMVFVSYFNKGPDEKKPSEQTAVINNLPKQ
ncbi:MAG: hypothetical protein ABSG99_02815 [Sedimentisphaerales bacterium]